MEEEKNGRGRRSRGDCALFQGGDHHIRPWERACVGDLCLWNDGWDGSPLSGKGAAVSLSQGVGPHPLIIVNSFFVFLWISLGLK